MSNFYVNLALLIFVLAGFIFLVLKVAKFKKYTIVLVSALVAFWALMYMQLNSPYNASQIHNDLGKWAFPLVASIYQLTQAAIRVPYGKFSQKLKSRNKVIQWAFMWALIALVIMIASKLSTWSLILAAFATGQFGATFGLDSQYISENYDIKKVFTSASVAFVIPIIGSIFAKTVYAGIQMDHIYVSQKVYFWLIFGVLALGFIGLIWYSRFKEDPEAIRLDNVDPSSAIFVKRGMKDVWAVSLTAGFLAFTYNFALTFGNTYMGAGYLSSVISIVGLGASVLVGIVLKQYISGRTIRLISLSFLMLSTSLLGLLMITGDINQAGAIVLMVFASLSFGMYVMALFGSALHFDHKYPALVLGIFLSVKSFALGTSTMASGLINVAGISMSAMGIGVLVVSIVSTFLTIIVSTFIVNRYRDNDMDKLVDDSFKFEMMYHGRSLE